MASKVSSVSACSPYQRLLSRLPGHLCASSVISFSRSLYSPSRTASSFPFNAECSSNMLQTRLSALQSTILSHIRALLDFIASGPPFWRDVPRHLKLSSKLDRKRHSRRTLAERIPHNAWDSHMHVVDPNNYPLDLSALYRPAPHLLSQAMTFESSLNISNIVLIQPSIYGNDNSCMLDALRKLGPDRGRAVVTFDPSTTSRQTLEEWHAIGVRGVRINLQSVRKSVDAAELGPILRRYADAIRPFNWVLQLYIPLSTLVALEAIIPSLRVRVCIDHFGHPTLPSPTDGQAPYSVSGDPYRLPGFASLINLLRSGSIFVKLSAPYRISKETDENDLVPVAKEILRVAGKKRVVFATDWPHTRFEGHDIKPFVERVLEWCGEDDALLERLFRGNAEELWGVKP